MFDFLKSLFNPAPPSGNTAKERLRLVLLSDHLSLAPDVVEALKKDLLAVISRYVTIDSAHADVTFEHRDNEVAMMANIPITGVRERERSAPVVAPAPSSRPYDEPVVEAEPIAHVEPSVLAEPIERVEPSAHVGPSVPAEPMVRAERVARPESAPALQTTMPLASDATSPPTVRDGASASADGAAVSGKTAQRRRRRKKAANALANATERKAATPPQPGYSAQA